LLQIIRYPQNARTKDGGKSLKERLLEKMNNIKKYLSVNFVECEMDGNLIVVFCRDCD